MNRAIGTGRQVMDWQPIETAPKDGSKVDLFGTLGKKYRRRATDCYWHKKAGRWHTHTHDNDGYSALRLPFEPTHWMRPPAPPAQGESK